MSTNPLLEKLEKIRNNRELKTTDLISINDLTDQEVEMIFDLTEEVETFLKGEMKKVDFLKGKSQLNFFMENSTRTRTSFELAGKNLGADTINISESSSSMQKGETLLDTAITLDQMQSDIIIMRTPNSGAVKFLAENVQSSVINAGDGLNEHPTQALLDLYTIRKNLGKNLKNRNMLIVGDILHSRVFGSLARLTRRFKLNLTVSAPHTLVRPHLDAWEVKHEPKLETAIQDQEVIYVLRLQTERAAASFVPTTREYSKNYCINANRLKLAHPNAIVMHPGPVIREMDIHTNVLETSKSVIPQQVFSGYCIRFVLLWLLKDKRKSKKIAPRLFKP